MDRMDKWSGEAERRTVSAESVQCIECDIPCMTMIAVGLMVGRLREASCLCSLSHGRVRHRLHVSAVGESSTLQAVHMLEAVLFVRLLSVWAVRLC